MNECEFVLFDIYIHLFVSTKKENHNVNPLFYAEVSDDITPYSDDVIDNYDVIPIYEVINDYGGM